MMTDKRDIKNSQPIDRGWAWVVMFGICLQLFLNIGVSKSFGLFFIQFLVTYKTNASLLSGVIAIQTAAFSLTSLFILNAGTRLLRPRIWILLGALLIPAGYLLNAFAPNVAFLILSQGVLFGTGSAAAMSPGLVVLSSYFNKRRGFANSISTVGGSIGSLVFPKIIQILIETYGLQGALLMVAGILFNHLIVVALLRPLPKNPKPIKQTVEEDLLLHTENRPVESVEMPESKLNGNYKKENNGVTDDGDILTSDSKVLCQTEINGDPVAKLKEPFKPEKDNSVFLPKSTNRVKEFTGSAIDIYTSTSNIACSLHDLKKRNDAESEVSNKSKCCTKESCLKVVDFELMKNHRLQLVLFVAFFCIFGCGLTITYIPPFARDHNISEEDIAILVMVAGAFDIVSRFSVAWIADSKRIKRTHIVGVTLLLGGSVTLLNSFFINFVSFAVYSGIFGLFGTVYIPFCPLLLVDAVGADNLSPSLSLLIMVHGISISIMAPVLGFIRDSTGSYNITFYVIGSGMIIAAIALFCEPWFKRLEEERVKGKTVTNGNDVPDINISDETK